MEFLTNVDTAYLATANAAGQSLPSTGVVPGDSSARWTGRRWALPICRQPAVCDDRQPRREQPGVPVADGLCGPAPDQAVGPGARGRGRCGAARAPHAGGLPGPAEAGHSVPGRGMGRELPAAHPAEAGCRRRGRGAAGVGETACDSHGGKRSAACQTGRVSAMVRSGTSRQVPSPPSYYVEATPIARNQHRLAAGPEVLSQRPGNAAMLPGRPLPA